MTLVHMSPRYSARTRPAPCFVPVVAGHIVLPRPCDILAKVPAQSLYLSRPAQARTLESRAIYFNTPITRSFLKSLNLPRRFVASSRFRCSRHVAAWGVAVCQLTDQGAGEKTNSGLVNGTSSLEQLHESAIKDENVLGLMSAADLVSTAAFDAESEQVAGTDDDRMSRKNIVYLVLCGIFFTNAIMGELTGGKFFQAGPLMLSIGTLQWPVVFLTTDLLNEYYGASGVKAATYVAVGLLLYVFAVLFAGMSVPAAPNSPISDATFQAAFGQSLWIIFGSVTAFFTSQLVDMTIFLTLKERTGANMLWLRATGSTIFSQLIDSFIVGALAFWLPGKFTFDQFVSASLAGYSTKLVLAVVFTPLIYGAHSIIDSYLGEELAHDMIEGVHPAKDKEHHH